MSRGRPFRSGSCADLAEERSALVDGALDPVRRERLLVHLVGCAHCRADVAELSSLRDALRSRTAAEAPQDLARRLVSIAGPQASVPLWSRPFRRTRPGCLPSGRRSRRLRHTAVAVALGATVSSAAVVGYVTAPTSALAEVSDPGADARAEFSSVLAQLPLASDALSAVAATRAADLATPATGTGAAGLAADFPATAGTRALPAAAAVATMELAADAGGRVSYTGRQSFRARSRAGTLSATVALESFAGEGTRSQVLDGSGRLVGGGFASETSLSRVVDSDVVSLLEDNYTLRAWSGAQAAQRAAVMVEARSQGRLAARWWIDAANGLVLAQQGFDATGQPVVQVAFTSLQLGGGRGVAAFRPVQLSLPDTDTVLTLSAAPALVGGGWVCPDRLAQLALVRLRGSGPGTPTALHLVYSDGLSTVSVFEQRGRLTDPPTGSVWDARLGAYVQEGTSSLASWQSGGMVLTVVTDGSPELLAAAAASLPHEPAPGPTTMRRIRAGWGRILAHVTG